MLVPCNVVPMVLYMPPMDLPLCVVYVFILPGTSSFSIVLYSLWIVPSTFVMSNTQLICMCIKHNLTHLLRELIKVFFLCSFNFLFVLFITKCRVLCFLGTMSLCFIQTYCCIDPIISSSIPFNSLSNHFCSSSILC